MTFETFDQSDEETWPNQKKDKDKDKDNDNDKDKDILKDKKHRKAGAWLKVGMSSVSYHIL